MSRTELPNRYMTPEEVSDLLSIPVQTLYQWRRKRTGPPAVRIGRHLRYEPSKLHLWLAGLDDEAAA